MPSPSLAHDRPLDQLAANMRLSSVSGDRDEHVQKGGRDDNNNGGQHDCGNTVLRSHMKRLQSSPTQTLLLDGGTGEELFLRGVPDDRKIWSATAIVHEQYHSILRDVHESFIDAGSQAITTNSYGITPGVGFTDGKEVKRLVGIAGNIARSAVDRSPQESKPVALVLGSLGPQVESYRPDLIMEHEDGVRAYQFAIEGLHPYIDVYLAETMSCLEEACQAIDALSKFYNLAMINEEVIQKHPLLVSFTLGSDGKVRSGESVVEVIPKLIQYSRDKGIELIGVLFNCCEPESITEVLKEIQSNTQIHHHLHHPPKPLSSAQELEKKNTSPVFLGAYAHRLTPVEPNWTLESSEEAQSMREDLSPEQYWEEHVKLWHTTNHDGEIGGNECGETDNHNHAHEDEIGCVQLIGGCCAIGPGHISILKERLKERERFSEEE